MRLAALFLSAAIWLGSVHCLAQAAFVPLRLHEGIVLAVPAGLREVAAPAAGAGIGAGARVFSDGAKQPLMLWVQSEVLPRADAAGRPITYKEYDVHPYQPGVNRGPERLVVGSDGKAYYTNDHYTTFTAVP